MKIFCYPFFCRGGGAEGKGVISMLMTNMALVNFGKNSKIIFFNLEIYCRVLIFFNQRLLSF